VGRARHTAIWTGEEMIVWGGSTCDGRARADGAAYAGTWRTTARSPISARSYHVAVWTGDEMIAWGGSRGRRLLVDGAACDPARDRWQRIPTPPPEIREVAGGKTAWSGDELVVWGHSDGSGSNVQQGAAFDPASRAWRALPDTPIRGRDRQVMVSTPAGVLVWGGCCRSGRYYGEGAIVTAPAAAPPAG
jgi:hypothetical protein